MANLIFACQLQAKVTNKAKLQANALKLAIASRKSGDNLYAVKILSKLRESYSDHKRINIELTLNFIKLRDYARAEQLVIHLQSLPLSEAEQRIVEKLKLTIEKQTQFKIDPHSFNFTSVTRTGIDILSNNYPVYVFEETDSDFDFWADDSDFYDDFFNDDDEIIEYSATNEFGDREEVTERTEVAYVSQAFRANYRYRPDKTISVFDQKTYWLFDVEGEVRFKHLDKATNNRLRTLQLDTSLYFIQTERFLFELNASAQLNHADGDKLVNRTLLRSSLSIPLKQIKWRFGFDHQQKHYRQSLSSFNAIINTPWLEYGYQFSSDYKFIAGVKLHQLNAQDEYNSYENNQGYLSLYYFPSRQLIAYMSYSHYLLKYDIDDPELVNWAKERKRSLSVGFSYQYTPDVTFKLNVNLGDNQIELDFGEDNWQRAEASLTYSF